MGLNIDFASLDNDMQEDIPIGPAEKALNEHIGQPGKATRETLNCFELLDAPTQEIIEAEAVDVYDRMSDETAYLMEYGQDTVDSMNALIDSLFNDINPVR